MAARVGELLHRVKSLEKKIVLPEADLRIYDCDGNLLFDLKEVLLSGYKERLKTLNDQKKHV